MNDFVLEFIDDNPTILERKIRNAYGNVISVSRWLPRFAFVRAEPRLSNGGPKSLIPKCGGKFKVTANAFEPVGHLADELDVERGTVVAIVVEFFFFYSIILPTRYDKNKTEQYISTGIATPPCSSKLDVTNKQVSVYTLSMMFEIYKKKKNNLLDTCVYMVGVFRTPVVHGALRSPQTFQLKGPWNDSELNSLNPKINVFE